MEIQSIKRPRVLFNRNFRQRFDKIVGIDIPARVLLVRIAFENICLG